MTEILETVWQVVKSPFVDESKKEPLKIRFALFFDGTNNNAVNIKEREKFEADQKSESDSYTKFGVLPDSSYDNGLTNIALMEPNVLPESAGYDFVFSIYVEGQGTFDLQDNAKFGLAMGTFQSGVYRRARLGLSKALEKLDRFFEENDPDKFKIEKLDIDVFGFSRGAATARHCIHVIGGHDLSDITNYVMDPISSLVSLNSPLELSVPAFYKRIYWRGFIDITEEQVKVKFAGLYDTVVSVNASQMTPTWLMGNIRNQRAVSKAEAALHLAAAEEHRSDFPLHTIKSAKKAGIGKEYYLPGVHSDVGGSYNLANTILLDNKQADAIIRRVIKTGKYNDMVDEYDKLIKTDPNVDTLVTEREKDGRPRKAVLFTTRKIDGMEYVRTTNEVNRIINRGLISDLLADMKNLTDAGWYKKPQKSIWDSNQGDVTESITDEIVVVVTDWTIKVYDFETSTLQPMVVGADYLKKAGDSSEEAIPYYGHLVVNRNGIKSAYNNIPLKIMAKEAGEHGINFNPKLKDRADATLEKEDDLLTLQSQIQSYMGKTGGKTSKPEDWLDDKSEFLQKIRHDHLHMSSRYKSAILDPGFTPSIDKNKRVRSYYEG